MSESWLQEVVLTWNRTDESFAEIVDTFILWEIGNDRLLADEMGCGLSTVRRWAQASSKPHHLMQAIVITWISKQAFASQGTA